MVVRTYEDELGYLERVNPHCWRIKKGFQPNMNVEVIHTSLLSSAYISDKVPEYHCGGLRFSIFSSLTVFSESRKIVKNLLIIKLILLIGVSKNCRTVGIEFE